MLPRQGQNATAGVVLLRTLQSKRSASKPMSRITREGVRDIRRLVISGSLRVRVVAVAIGAETGFSSPQTGCRMLPGRGTPVRELMVHNPTLVRNRNRGLIA